MEFGLWSTLILIVLVLMALVGLCLLQIPLARRRAWWPGLIQPALWLASALLSMIIALPDWEGTVPGMGAWIMMGLTLAVWAGARLRHHGKKET